MVLAIFHFATSNNPFQVQTVAKPHKNFVNRTGKVGETMWGLNKAIKKKSQRKVWFLQSMLDQDAEWDIPWLLHQILMLSANSEVDLLFSEFSEFQIARLQTFVKKKCVQQLSSCFF